MSRFFVVRVGRSTLSLRVGRRVPLALLVLALVTGGLMVVNLSVGQFPLGVGDAARALVGAGDPGHELIVRGLRLPRLLVALTVGAALGSSGGILQQLTGNPLAAPELVGITGGANLAAVTVLILVPGLPAAALPGAAFAGALAAAAVVYVLAWRGGSHPIRLLLVGIGVTAAAQAVVTAVVTMAPIFYAARAITHLTGSVYARGWADLLRTLPWLVVLLPLALLLARWLDALHLGDDIAAVLGVRVEPVRALLTLVAVGLAAAGVAAAGPLAFVGLLAPHIARRLVGPGSVGLLAVAALTGGALVIAADTVGRTAAAPIEIPAGAITPVVGVPYLVALLIRGQRPDGGL